MIDEGVIVREFSTKIETGELVSMSIRPGDGASPFLDLLNDATAALEAAVDKRDLAPINITSPDECAAVSADLLADKTVISTIDATLKPFSDIAFKLHRAITGKGNYYRAFPQARIAIRDRALVAWDDQQQREARAEAERNRQIAQAEEEARRKEEAAELERRAKSEKRPELKQRAEEIRNEPVRVASFGGTAKSARVKTDAGSVGLKESYDCEVTDSDDLILAIGAPAGVRLAATIIEEMITKKTPQADRNRLIGAANYLRMKAAELAQIPTSIVEIKETQIRKNAEATNGRINWPGCSIFKSKKTTTRR